MPYKYAGPDRRKDLERRAEVEAILRTADYRNRRRRTRRRIEEIIRNLVFVLVIALVWIISHQQTSAIVSNSRAGCIRGADSYLTSAQAWRNDARNWQTAADTRRRDGDGAVAATYEGNAERNVILAQHLEFLAGSRDLDSPAPPRLDLETICAKRYPKPGVLSFGG